MIEYERFKAYMEELKIILDEDKELDDVLGKISPDFGGFHNEKAIELIMKLLKRLTNDYYDWISFYVWECDFGKEKGRLFDSNDKEIPFKTIEDLYNVLKENY